MRTLLPRSRLALALFALSFAAPAHAADRTKPPSPREWEELHRLLLPQPGESKWLRVPWRTDLAAARREAAAADKPLFVWRCGGGELLGRA